jgi:DNA (cytosine-5)-methyltransferase 1
VSAYYNEIDPYVAQWLRNLVARGLIAPGDVDERSIADVCHDDLRGYRQCHFFAGIGGWSCALRLAEWPDDRPVWTGSCPCQPFSTAGAGKAADDERHLWPSWFSLIRECRPPIVFGEQVEAAIGWGWLDVVFADLEAESYACGAAVFPACSIGAPHIRQRLWFVANADIARCGTRRPDEARDGRHAPRLEPTRLCADGSVANASGAGLEIEREQPARNQCATVERISAVGTWSDLEWLPCTDGKSRPTQPGLFTLAHGVPRRVGRLRAYGNAIVPQVAAQFIKASASETR